MLPNSIPPTTPEKARTLVLCFDGTGDQFDSDNSNIVQFFSMLKKDDRTKQMVYYQAGIGTYTSPQIATPMAAKISKILDEAVAWDLSAHVMGGYEFLMQNYQAGDRICIFGFSRGAYTARSLAGMIHKVTIGRSFAEPHPQVGLLPASNFQQIPFAYKMYTRADEVGWAQSNTFKKAFSVDVPIEFIGVWDTVSSVGLIPKRLPFTTSNTIVRTFRHALALDEHRAKFKANMWNRPSAEESSLGVEGQKPEIPAHRTTTIANEEEIIFKGNENLLECRYAETSDRPTDVEEVWFVGAHCDVGGGSVSNGTPYALARISLRWMIRECFKAKSGIIFVSKSLREVGLDPLSLYPCVQKRPPPLHVGNAQIQNVTSATQQKLQDSSGMDSLVEIAKTEEDHELLDVLSPIYDQLTLAPMWWILEFLPIKQHYQKGDNSWASTIYPNLGRGRVIPQQETHVIRVHRSVRQRMEAQYPDGSRYQPKASIKVALELENVEWVD
ncbi:hypothetical protein J132_04157 [Termitomyces sp. J132]|nr:hypothetical protein J132_04157 [Termitomyces sp. J132]